MAPQIMIEVFVTDVCAFGQAEKGLEFLANPLLGPHSTLMPHLCGVAKLTLRDAIKTKSIPKRFASKIS